MNKRDELFVEYQKTVREKQKNDHQAELDEKKLEELKSQQKKAEQNIRTENKNKIEELKNQILKKRSLAAEKRRQIKDVGGDFDMDAAGKSFDKETDTRRQQMTAQLTGQCNEAKGQLQHCLSEQETWKEQEKRLVEADEKLAVKIRSLKKLQQENSLPPNIVCHLEKQSDEEMIRAYHIQSGRDIIAMGENVGSLNGSIDSVPEWKIYAFSASMLLSGIVAGILAYLISMMLGGGFGAVAAGTANGVAVFFQKFAVTFSGMVLGAIIGAIIGTVLYIFLLRGEWRVISFGAIISGIIGGVIRFRNAYARGISSDTSYMVENTARKIFLVVVWMILLFIVVTIISKNSLHVKAAEMLLNTRFLKAKALEKQTQVINTYLDHYYITIRYQEILDKISEDQRTARENQLSEKLTGLKGQLQKMEKDFLDMRLGERDKVILSWKQAFDDEKNRLIAANRSLKEEIQRLNTETDELDSQIIYREENLEEIIREGKKRYQQEIDKCQQDLKAREMKKISLTEKIKALVSEFDGCKIPLISETFGKMSDAVYWEQPGSELGFADIRRLEHDQQPMLFLYFSNEDIKEERKADKVYDMIKRLLFEFLYNNSLEVLRFNIIDNYKKAIDLQVQQEFHCYDDKNIGELLEKAESVINNVATHSGGKTWNEVIAAEAERSGIFDKYQCQVTAVFVPPSKLVKTQFRGELWQLVRMGKEKGFIPLFFADGEDYEYYNPEKDSGTAIEKLHQVFEEKNHIYRLNLDTGRIG